MTAAVFIAPKTLPVPAPVAGADGKAEPAPAPQVQKRTQAELDALRQVVINALGLKPGPGQSPESLVSLQEVEFQTAAVPAQLSMVGNESRIQGWVQAAAPWAAVAGGALVLLIFWRLLSRQKPEAVPIEILSMSADNVQRNLPTANNVTPELLNDLIRQKPANIGIALREWVSAGSAPAGKN